MDTRLDHISSVISVCKGIPLPEDGKLVARYRANVDSTATINCKVDMSMRAVVVNVGCLPMRHVSVARDPRYYETAIDTSFEISDVVRAEVEGSVRKVNGQSGSWRFADMSGVVHVLAASIAYYRAFGKLTMQVMKGGDDEQVPCQFSSLRGITSEVSADSGKVYIPSHVVTQMQPGCMSAFIAAVTGAGGHCITDVAGVGIDNRVIIPTCEGYSLAGGCYDALALLGKYYNANGVGELFAFCVSTGMHSVMTVHGHSDEGGFMREFLRRIKYCTPYGGLSVSAGDFTGLPKVDKYTDYIKMVDSIVIQTAGCVSLADPMVEFEGKYYPTTLASAHVRDERESRVIGRIRATGTNTNVGSIGDALSISKMLTDVFPDFCVNYSCLLGRMMCVEGGGEIVQRLMVGHHYSTMDKHYAHLKYEVVNPFFWVESTGTTRVNCGDMPCVRSGYGRLCALHEPGEKPFFEGLTIKDTNNSLTGALVRFVGARRHGLLHHLQGHKLDGLGHIHVRSLRSSNLFNYGHGARSDAGVNPDEMSIREKVEANVGLDKFLWGRGHSSIITPGEMLYTGENIGFVFEHVAGDVYTPEPTHFPRYEELHGHVTFRVSSLHSLDIGRPDDRFTKEDKKRRGAIDALSKARVKHTIWKDVSALMQMNIEEEEEVPVDPVQFGSSAAAATGFFVGRFDAGPIIAPVGIQGTHTLPRVPGGARQNNAPTDHPRIDEGGGDGGSDAPPALP